MNLKDFKTSKFLKREDVGTGALVTIVRVCHHNVAQEGAPEESKPCLEFAEFDKPMVCNSTNAQTIMDITGVTDNFETGWIGKQIVIYDDPNVSFGGKRVGGIRCRAPRIKPGQVQTPQAPEVPDDLPF